MNSDYNFMFKQIIVGDSGKFFIIIAGVGKSCLLMQFAENKFYDHTESTLGVEFGYKTIRVSD